MLQILFLLLLTAPLLPFAAHAEDNSAASLFGNEHECERFDTCGQQDDKIREENIGDTQELGNSFDNDGSGNRRSIGDIMNDQLSPASGR